MPCSLHNGLNLFMKLKFKQIEKYEAQQLQLRDPKNDFIFNFNFYDEMKIFERFEFGTN